MSKLPHKLDDEDLLSVVEGTEDAAPIVYPTDILHFIATFNIEPGEENIKQFSLYNIYKVWSSDPVKKTEFMREMGTYFSIGQSGHSQAFKINQSAIKLTHQAFKYFSNNNIKLHSPKWARHFENFLKFHALSAGDYWINQEILYFIYDKYAHATGLDAHPNAYMKKETFFIYCKIFLKQKLTKNETLYAISDNIKQFFQIDQLARMERMYAEEKEQKIKRRSSKLKRQSKSKN